MSKKGASLIFEQVLLCGVGVIMFIIFYAVFSIYQSYFISTGNDNQLEQVKEYIAENILEVSQRTTDSFIILSLPKDISNNVFLINLSSEQLLITNALTGMSKFSTLYALNETGLTFSGNATSYQGKITIKKEENNIRIS